jgi:hypothetical protein
MTEQLQLRCGNCAWYNEAVIAEEEQPPEWTPRGQCYANPPSVFPIPIPKQGSNLAIVQRQQQGMEVAPAMLRPIVEEETYICGSYQPNKLAREALDEIRAQRQAEGCDPNECGKEGCNCGG